MHHHSDRRRSEEQREEENRREEEERLTPYSPGEIGGDWQFKIVHGAFSSPDSVEAVIQEQAQFGWVLVEKFDDSRIRFKRPASEAQHDAARGGDPYATRSVVAGGGCLVMLTLLILLGTGTVVLACM